MKFGFGVAIIVLAIVLAYVLRPYFAAYAGQSAERAVGKDQECKDVLSVIHSRKSVRAYLDKPIEREQLDVLLRAAMAAPTAMDKRPWRFVAIDDKAVMIELAKGLEYAQMLKGAAAAIVVCGDMDATLEGEGREYWIQDCSAATENLLLAAEGIGLGAVWTGVYPKMHRVEYVQKVLGLPENVVPLNVIPIGWPTGREKPKQKYDPANIHWDKW